MMMALLKASSKAPPHSLIKYLAVRRAKEGSLTSLGSLSFWPAAERENFLTRRGGEEKEDEEEGSEILALASSWMETLAKDRARASPEALGISRRWTRFSVMRLEIGFT